MGGLSMRQHVKTDEHNRRTLTEALFHQHASAIIAYLRRQHFSREDAEDLLLEIFTAMLEQKHFEQLLPDQQRGLLWRIARNKVIDVYRKTKNRSSVAINLVEDSLFVSDEQVPESEIVRMEEYSQLRAFIQALSPLQQRVLHLRFIQELRSPQIALLVGKSETAVRQMLSRTLHQLRQLYKEGER